ncbi:nucleotidyltransferase domain-containing protein [Breznakiellaceae bacterium SP9]
MADADRINRASPLQVTTTIGSRLAQIETEHTVKILYAAESGSRAWGFESADSDYDVRFIYAHPKDWYLNILPKRDVIEYPITDEHDFSGWDLRKALLLVHKSNPVLFEWLRSPLVYYRDRFFYTLMNKLSKEYFSPRASVYHYLHMAKGNFRQYLQDAEVKIKKYFYVLRPVLACMWIETHNESPPMEFAILLTQITERTLLDAVNELLALKKSGVELALKPKNEVLNTFIDEKIRHFEDAASLFAPQKKPDASLLEASFRQLLDYMESEKAPKL